ncbi:isochorismatase family protein [Kribbella sp. NPDC056861]|uniref:isochorismatase family protein n=1 Tax=Kribbella sp. NPDC056861 TaxID=3154857 RepID=UPI0034251BD8
MLEPVQALLLIDLQLGSLAAVPEAPRLLDRAGDLLTRARQAGALVLHVQNDGAPGTPDAPGEPGWDLHFTVEPGARETTFRKLQDDSFADTPLSDLLAAHDVKSVALCGLMSEMCVSATARTALARGLRVVLPHDAHTTTGIPATATTPAVSAEVVSRVAEWALGDELEQVERAAEVRFSYLR